MAFTFSAKIYKVGINPCVKVPARITNAMRPERGYILVKGKIEMHVFKQTLVPVKGAPYRLFVNGPMLKGAKVQVGETASFTIEQNFASRNREFPMLKAFKTELEKNKLYTVFKRLTPHRQKEILKYLNYLKTEHALTRNIEKIIHQLKNKSSASKQ